mgnify:FL=1
MRSVYPQNLDITVSEVFSLFQIYQFPPYFFQVLVWRRSSSPSCSQPTTTSSSPGPSTTSSTHLGPSYRGPTVAMIGTPKIVTTAATKQCLML